jgi:hypothetical protein
MARIVLHQACTQRCHRSRGFPSFDAKPYEFLRVRFRLRPAIDAVGLFRFQLLWISLKREVSPELGGTARPPNSTSHDMKGALRC